MPAKLPAVHKYGGLNMRDENNEILEAAKTREKMIVRTSAIGIAANVLLVAFKAFVGFMSNSIAVMLDAVNNLSDAFSSVVTIIGAKLGAKQPDKKHPMGYGRIEYLSSMIVAAIVLYAGLTSLTESVKKIIEPETADYNTLSLIIISVAIVVKVVLGLFVKKQGVKYNSGALTASGSDALFDAVLSTSVLVSAVIFLIWGISLEAYVGVIISIFIIKAGIEMMTDTVNEIIGKRGDAETSRELKRIICAESDVLGVYDIALFNYGPDRNYASLHIELPDTITVDKVDRITRRIQTDVFREMGIIITGISIYSFNTTDNEAAEMREKVREAVLKHEWALQMHGFYVETESKTMRFDVVISFGVDRKQALATLYEETEKLYPEYDIQIVSDVDMTDLHDE